MEAKIVLKWISIILFTMIVRIWGSPLRVKKIGNNRSPNFHRLWANHGTQWQRNGWLLKGHFSTSWTIIIFCYRGLFELYSIKNVTEPPVIHEVYWKTKEWKRNCKPMVVDINKKNQKMGKLQKFTFIHFIILILHKNLI